MKTKQFTTRSGEIFNLTSVSQVDLTPLAQKAVALQPQPPVEVVQSANGPKEFVNENHPDFLKAKREWEVVNGLHALAALIELGVDLELAEEQQALVERRRKKLIRLNGNLPQYDYDIYVYISAICDEDEITDIANQISSINTPTAQQVQAHVDQFRPGVPGPAPHENKDAPKWNNFPEPELDLDALPGGEVLEHRPDSLLRRTGPRVAG